MAEEEPKDAQVLFIISRIDPTFDLVTFIPVTSN